jgi:hypothetical protein
VAVHLVLGATAIGTVLFAAAAPWTAQTGTLPFEVGTAPTGRPSPHVVMAAGMVVASAAGVVAFVCTHRRRYLTAAWACAFAMVGTLGVYQSTMSRAARLRQGDAMTAVAAGARRLASETGLPLRCRQFETVEIRALLGINRRGEEPEDVATDRASLVVTTGTDWHELTSAYPGQHTLLLVTAPRSEVPERLVVGRFEPAPH